MEQNQSLHDPLSYQALLLDRVLTQEVSEELSLPDYQPPIKRLLRVSATVQPPTRYIGGGNIEFSGSVDFNVLYAGEDGALYCFPTSADYVLRTAADGDCSLTHLHDESLCCYVTLEPDMMSGRVGGPRKLSVRCRLRGRIRAWGKCQGEEVWTGKLSGTPQRLRREQSGIRVLSHAAAPLQLQDEILLDRAVDPNAVRIVSAEATVLPEEITTATDRLSCRGQLCLKLLLQKECAAPTEAPSCPTCIQRKIPFSTDLNVPGLLGGGEAVVNGCCSELGLTLEDGRISCEAEVLLEAKAQQQETLSYTADVCCVGQHSTTQCTERVVCRPIRCINANFSHNETASLKDMGIPAGAQIADVTGIILPDSISVTGEGSRCNVCGTARYSLIYYADGEAAAREIELPFRYVAELGTAATALSGNMEVDAGLGVIGVRARTDEREGRLSLDAELCVALQAWETRAIPMLSSVALSDASQIPVGARLLYYPLPGETLWDVAKRYCCSVERLSAVNSLPGAPRADDAASLRGVPVVVIA